MASPRASEQDRPNVLKPREKGGSNSANRASGSDTVKPFSRGEVDVYLRQDRSPSQINVNDEPERNTN